MRQRGVHVSMTGAGRLAFCPFFAFTYVRAPAGGVSCSAKARVTIVNPSASRLTVLALSPNAASPDRKLTKIMLHRLETAMD